MKKIFRKKMILPLVAGIMTTVIALGGTFAWFTSTAHSTNGQFKTARVALVADKGYNNVWNFYPGHAYTIAAQKSLEDAVNTVNQDLANSGLLAWWQSYQTGTFDSQWALHYDEHEAAVDGKVNYIVYPDEKTSDDYTDKVTPGSFIYRHFDFVNDSNVPVYFRVATPTISANGHVVPYAAFMTIGSNPKYEMLVDGGDGYLYFPQPIEDGATVSLMFHAYLSGALNGNELQEKTISFGATGAELIQATNNAVYLEGTWSDKVDYIPYAPVQ